MRLTRTCCRKWELALMLRSGCEPPGQLNLHLQSILQAFFPLSFPDAEHLQGLHGQEAARRPVGRGVKGLLEVGAAQAEVPVPRPRHRHAARPQRLRLHAVQTPGEHLGASRCVTPASATELRFLLSVCVYPSTASGEHMKEVHRESRPQGNAPQRSASAGAWRRGGTRSCTLSPAMQGCEALRHSEAGGCRVIVAGCG